MTELPSPAVIATGPLTSDALASAIRRRLGVESLAFYDAIAPIVDFESIDQSVVFRASRYGKETHPTPLTPLPSLREGRGEEFFVPLRGTLLTAPLGAPLTAPLGAILTAPLGRILTAPRERTATDLPGRTLRTFWGGIPHREAFLRLFGRRGPFRVGAPPTRFKHPPPFRDGGPGGGRGVRTSIAQ